MVIIQKNLVPTAMFCAAIVFANTLNASGQDIISLESGAVGTILKLRELATTASVLHVVAHPDDEDGALLAYCARSLGARTMLFSITRGEGGANMISSHFFDELGALRTLEHLKAAGYYGNRLFYSRAADYGYSKSLDEAMTQWKNGLPILEDLVEVIRRERPQVMLSRFRGDPRDGHGHHQMAGVLSRVAFRAAADPAQFPDQLHRGLRPWQVQKLYVRAGSPWRAPEPEEWSLAVPTGTYDPFLGRSYAEVARFGLGFQRSQGISGHEGTPGPRPSYYRLVENSDAAVVSTEEASLLDGVDTSLAGLVIDAEPTTTTIRSQLAEIDAKLSNLSAQFQPLQTQTLLPQLVTLLREIRGLDFDRVAPTMTTELRLQLARKEVQLQEAILLAGGLRIDSWATDSDDNNFNQATPGQSVRVHLRVANQSAHVTWSQCTGQFLLDGQAAANLALPSNELAPSSIVEANVDVDLDRARPTRPHWHRDAIARPLYERLPESHQRPVPLSPCTVHVTLILHGETIQVARDVRVRQTHPEFGEVTYPLVVVPAMSVRFPLARSIALTRGNNRILVKVRYCGKEPGTGTLRLQLPPHWTSIPAFHELSFTREDEEASLEFELQMPADTQQQAYEIRAIVEHREMEYTEGFETVTARDLGRLNVFQDAVHRISVADVAMLGKPLVGYIPGSGDQVAESLGPLGIEPQILSTSDLASGDLSAFGVIMVGVRAYAVREDIRQHNARLLDYVRRGGVLVVQYQTPEFDYNFGPYPYEMGQNPEEVSQEDAAVTILAPEHSILSIPNQISPADFDGWFEQRGSKFWSSWDEHYIPLLECHDTGQAPQSGGLLATEFGEGVYVYCAYAWYRQLPYGVPGAYRIVANLLSLPKSK